MSFVDFTDFVPSTSVSASPTITCRKEGSGYVLEGNSVLSKLVCAYRLKIDETGKKILIVPVAESVDCHGVYGGSKSKTPRMRPVMYAAQKMGLCLKPGKWTGVKANGGIVFDFSLMVDSKPSAPIELSVPPVPPVPPVPAPEVSRFPSPARVGILIKKPDAQMKAKAERVGFAIEPWPFGSAVSNSVVYAVFIALSKSEGIGEIAERVHLSSETVVAIKRRCVMALKAVAASNTAQATALKQDFQTVAQWIYEHTEGN